MLNHDETFSLWTSPISGPLVKAETATSTKTPNEDGDKTSGKVKQRFELSHDIAAFHATAVVKTRDRANLLWAVGPNRRALCARRDLEIRRQLCKLGKVN